MTIILLCSIVLLFLVSIYSFDSIQLCITSPFRVLLDFLALLKLSPKLCLVCFSSLLTNLPKLSHLFSYCRGFNSKEIQAKNLKDEFSLSLTTAFFGFWQIGLAVGDIESIQKNAELKRMSLEVRMQLINVNYEACKKTCAVIICLFPSVLFFFPPFLLLQIETVFEFEEKLPMWLLKKFYSPKVVVKPNACVEGCSIMRKIRVSFISWP